MDGDTVQTATRDAVDELRAQLAAERNGTAEQPQRFRLKPPVYQRVHLKGEYAGAWLDMLLNPGLGLVAQLGTPTGIATHLHELARDWNLADQQGEPLPLSAAGSAQIDDELAGAIITAWQEAVKLSKRH